MNTFKTLLKSSLVTLLIVSGIALYASFSAQAGALSAVYLYLSRMKAGLDGSTSGQEVELVLAIETSQAIPSGGSLTIEFPDDADATWCRTAGSLTVTAVSSSAVDSTGAWSIDSALPTSGTLSATCTQGAGASSLDTITITQVGALSSSTTYGVKLESNTGIIGTNGSAGSHEVTVTAKNGATIDSKTFEFQLVSEDTVNVQATVADVPTVTCSISATTVDLGSLYPGGSYATGTHTITANSSQDTGYYWAAYGEGDGSSDAGLYNSTGATELLQSGSTATLDLRVANSEGFGLTVSQPTGTTVTSSFASGTPGVFGTLDREVAGAKLLLYRTDSSSGDQVATVTYGARANSSALAGEYNEYVTFVCGGYY